MWFQVSLRAASQIRFCFPLFRYGWETPFESPFLKDRVAGCVVFKSSFLEKPVQPLSLGVAGRFLVVLDRLTS